MPKTEREKMMKAASEKTTRRHFSFIDRVLRASIEKIKPATSRPTVLDSQSE